jgi:Single-stranded DNA-binding protein
MNQVVLVGNLTDDPELRYTQSGATLAGFTVAVSHRRWVPSSVDPSGRATSTARAQERNSNGSSRAASQPTQEDRRRSEDLPLHAWFRGAVSIRRQGTLRSRCDQRNTRPK